MKKTAFIFPGQGSQFVGMGKDLYENYEQARKVFDTANEALGYAISEICFNGPEDTLKQTKNTQPAILATSLACLEVIKSVLSMSPIATAGHSLGEYGALYLSGVLDLNSALKITGKRAELMNEAAENTTGTMAAVLGLSNALIEEGLGALNKDGIISVANYNCPGQTVITGEKHLIEKSIDILKAKGAKRVIELPVSGAFHSGLMKDAAIKFEEYIADYIFNNGTIPVYENTDAMPYILGAELKGRLSKQIYSPVRWTETISSMLEFGVEIFVEIGPGKVLAGLNKKINPEIKTYNVYDTISLTETLEEIR